MKRRSVRASACDGPCLLRKPSCAKLALSATLVFSFVLVATPEALGGFGLPAPQQFSGSVQATPRQGQTQQTSGDTHSAPAPAATPTTTCKTNKRTHVKTCRTYIAGALVKVCTQKRYKKAVCYKVGTPLRTLSGLRAAIPNMHVPTGALGLPRPGPWVFRPASLQAALGFTGFGVANPVLPGVVRLYKTGSPVPDSGWCSGVLVRRGIVLTAGHCLYDTTEEDPAGSTPGFYGFANGALKVVPGNEVAGGQNHGDYGVWNVANVFVPPAYAQDVSTSDKSSDWGLILLAPDSQGRYAGDFAGVYSATWDVSGITSDTPLYATGYPATGVFRTPQYHYGENQFFCKTTLDDVLTDTQVGAYWLKYPCYMNGGSSGGPVFAQLSDNSWTVVGVTNRGHDNVSGGYADYQLSIWFDDRFASFWNATLAYITGN